MQTVWKKSKLFPSIIGGPLLTAFCQKMMFSEPDRFRKISDIHMQLFDSDAPIMRNSEGELAFYMDGVYFPIQRGHWIVPEQEEFIDDNGKTILEFCDWRYNAIVEVQGLHFLMYIQMPHKHKTAI